MLFSATLHSPDITTVSKQICKHPQWVDLKGKDFVPDTVHHSVIVVDPLEDKRWAQRGVELPRTDGVHAKDDLSNPTDRLAISQRCKLLKPLILKQLVDTFEMSHSILFCRTRDDCDNLEDY